MIAVFRSGAVAALTLMLVACAGMPGHVSRNTSDFDGETQVEMEPARVDGPSSLVTPFLLGAKWTTAEPGKVWIVVAAQGAATDGYVSLKSDDGLQFRIDGELVKLNAQGQITEHDSEIVTGTVYQESSKWYLADLDLLRDIVDSEVTKVKVITRTGYLEGRVVDQANSARRGFERFITEVEQVKSEGSS